MSTKGFVKPGMLLVVDAIILGISGWLFWILIAKFTTTSEIGQASTVFTLVALFAAISLFGLEYPILKKSSTSKSQILGTSLVIELIITVALLPVLIYGINTLYENSLQQFTGIGIAMIILTTVGFVSRFTLLGISDAKHVVILDIAASLVRFLVGIILVIIGLGAMGIIIAFLTQQVIFTVGTLVIAHKTFSLGSINLKIFKELIKDGLINTPSKLSKIIIIYLGVILLAYFGISEAEVGVFFVLLIISMAVGSLATNFAVMAVPASSIAKIDLSSDSLRIGLSLTVPLISVFILVPEEILSVIGPEYSSHGWVMMILAAAAFPSIIVINAVSKFNNLNERKKLLIVGSIQILSFLTTFWILVPNYGIAGGAISILLGFTTSAIISMMWFKKTELRVIAVAFIAIASGLLLSYIVESTLTSHPVLISIISICVSIAILRAFKNISILELKQLVNDLIKKS